MNKKYDEILSSVQSDYSDALLMLGDFFDETNTEFTVLYNEAMNPSNNFNEVTFIKSLKLFVGKNKKIIDAIESDEIAHKDGNIDQNELFTLLSALNFKKQEAHFKNLVEHRKLSVFVIRGEGNCGQEWLLHQLIDVFPQKGVYSVNVFELDIHPTFDHFLEHIKERFKIDFSNSRTKAKASVIVGDLLRRAKSELQFLVFKKSYSFIHSSAFKEFYEYLLDHLHIELGKGKNLKKIVIFFVEDTASPYNIDSLGCESHFFEDGNRANQLSFTTKWKDSHDNLKIAGLYSIENFDLSLMNNWLSTVTHTEILEHFCDTDSVEKMLCDCGNGNPHEIITTISLKLNYTWQKY